MMCKFEHDGDCCNCGSPQYMCKCKPDVCGSAVPMTNADRIRAMPDKELAEFLCHFRSDDAATCSGCKSETYCRPGHNGMIDWLQQPVEEDEEEND